MIIDCKHLSKAYGSFKVLEDVTFQINKPSITGMIGRNGAGKTTLLKILAGCWKNTTGHMKVFGHEPFDSLMVSGNSIFVDDFMAFPETLTLWDLLEEGKRFYPNWDHELATRLFHYFQFSHSMFHHRLSKGKKSTFNMIVGLASRAPLTIFDEPTTGMDRAVRTDFYRALLKDYLNYPRTIIISSHHLDEIDDILEDMILMDEGKLILHLPLDEVREYAIGVVGNATDIKTWIEGKEVLFQESVGIDEMYVVIRNHYSIKEMEQKGFKISNISGADLSIYLTNKRKGGIDDVFHQAN